MLTRIALRMASIAVLIGTTSLATAGSTSKTAIADESPLSVNVENWLPPTIVSCRSDDSKVQFRRQTSANLTDQTIAISRTDGRSSTRTLPATTVLVQGHTDFSDEPTSDEVLANSTLDPEAWHPIDTLSVFGGLEGSKQPQDFGVNANFGGRWAANWGFPLLADYGIGAQIGMSINYTDNAVQVFERVGASTHRTQNFSTAGIFQRTDTWRWGVAYDFLYESYYDQFILGQWRGRVGYATSEADEFGVWCAVPQQSSSGQFLTIPVQLTPLTQGSFYWQHQFLAGTRVMSWAGAAEGHAQANLALGDLKKTGPQFVFGAEIDVPLNANFSIYGQANFIGPADTGTVDSFLGVSYYPGGRAFPSTRSRFAPYQALANSTMFALDLWRP
ncbi:MAG: DUF6666 family protein [Planctomycetaceae bacterium]